MLDPARKVPQFHVEGGGVHVVQRRCVAVRMKLRRFPILAVEPQERHRPGKNWIVGRHCTAVTNST